MFMVFNATINNISVISRWSVLLVEETVESRENHRPSTCTNLYIEVYVQSKLYYEVIFGTKKKCPYKTGDLLKEG